MKRYIIYILITCAMFTGCRTKTVILSENARDSVYITHDSIVVRWVRDSVSERLQTGYEVRNDTVYITNDRIVERWRLRTDTVTVVRWRDAMHKEQTSKETTIEKKRGEIPAILIFGTVILAILICLRRRLFHRI